MTDRDICPVCGQPIYPTQTVIYSLVTERTGAIRHFRCPKEENT